MSYNGADGAKGASASPARSRHQISRSISELSSPIRLHRHHSHRAAAKEKERERDGLSPISQIPTATSAMSSIQVRVSLDGSRSEGITPNLSPNQSRRASILVASNDDGSPAPPAPIPVPVAVAGLSNVLSNKTTTSKEDELVKERQRAVARESGLKTSLTALESFSTATTRRLDDTYYSVLERLGALQSTMMALKELAGLSRDMATTFSADAQELTADISAQLDAFGQFEDQQQRIEALQGRVHVGRDRIRALSERVDVVRERIERWERADREWQERTRKRLRIVWVLTSVVVVFVLLLVLSAQYAPESLMEGRDAAGRVADDSLGMVRNVTAGRMDMLWSGGGGGGEDDPGIRSADGHGQEARGTEPPATATAAATPDLLRAFDEL
ncbi:hypothetical protein B0T17DRAFT_530791 [Bombardia bombarda]|uniref:Uncharacterized protein n=1 Tax=Bombardia bombarda TaxID=252184 RepID=A0AA39WZV6_9PEZI|nr:hypothetical protein B0T17DRAFT_530791 [Bombardia bombarda]